MLIGTPGGFDYTGADCSQWMKEAGFPSTSSQPLVGPDSMVIGDKLTYLLSGALRDRARQSVFWFVRRLRSRPCAPLWNIRSKRRVRTPGGILLSMGRPVVAPDQVANRIEGSR